MSCDGISCILVKQWGLYIPVKHIFRFSRAVDLLHCSFQFVCSATGSSTFKMSIVVHIVTKLCSRQTNRFSSLSPVYLYQVVNLQYSEVQDRVMLTGRHMVRDVSCKNCNSKLGWIYEFATEDSQRYKEGRVILERALVRESEGFEEHVPSDNSWETWVSSQVLFNRNSKIIKSTKKSAYIHCHLSIRVGFMDYRVGKIVRVFQMEPSFLHFFYILLSLQQLFVERMLCRCCNFFSLAFTSVRFEIVSTDTVG